MALTFFANSSKVPSKPVWDRLAAISTYSAAQIPRVFGNASTVRGDVGTVGRGVKSTTPALRTSVGSGGLDAFATPSRAELAGKNMRRVADVDTEDKFEEGEAEAEVAGKKVDAELVMGDEVEEVELDAEEEVDVDVEEEVDAELVMDKDEVEEVNRGAREEIVRDGNAEEEVEEDIDEEVEEDAEEEVTGKVEVGVGENAEEEVDGDAEEEVMDIEVGAGIVLHRNGPRPPGPKSQAMGKGKPDGSMVGLRRVLVNGGAVPKGNGHQGGKGLAGTGRCGAGAAEATATRAAAAMILKSCIV